MPFLIRVEQRIQQISHGLGKLTALLFLCLLANVAYDVVTRYVFNDVSIGMQELEWHLFSAMFLLGVPYALAVGGHVRVDLIYERLGSRPKAWIDLLGTLILLFPFCLLVATYGVDFAREAYLLGERSGDPGGLAYRWIIKAMIPVSFGFMALAGGGLLLTSLNTLLGYHEQPHYHSEL